MHEELPAPQELTIVVELPDSGERLDRFLVSALGNVSRSQVQRAIRLSLVTIDGVVAWKTGIEIKAGQEIVYQPAPTEPVLAAPEDIPLDVLYEDEHIIVINKAWGMVVHPAAGHPSGTLVNALLGRYPEMAGMSPLRPGIVHRLDRGTSGAMVVARTEKAREGLSVQFLDRTLLKGYVALLRGAPTAASGVIDRPIGRHPADRKRFSSRVEGGRAAGTLWRKLAARGTWTVAGVRILTGRTHQIRVHFADQGWPVAGDDLYDSAWRARVKGPLADLLVQGPMLHSALLCLKHPITDAKLRLQAPLPSRMRAAIEAALGEEAGGVPEVLCSNDLPGGEAWETQN